MGGGTEDVLSGDSVDSDTPPPRFPDEDKVKSWRGEGKRVSESNGRVRGDR